VKILKFTSPDHCKNHSRTPQWRWFSNFA